MCAYRARGLRARGAAAGGLRVVRFVAGVLGLGIIVRPGNAHRAELGRGDRDHRPGRVLRGGADADVDRLDVLDRSIRELERGLVREDVEVVGLEALLSEPVIASNLSEKGVRNHKQPADCLLVFLRHGRRAEAVGVATAVVVADLPRDLRQERAVSRQLSSADP